MIGLVEPEDMSPGDLVVSEQSGSGIAGEGGWGVGDSVMFRTAPPKNLKEK